MLEDKIINNRFDNVEYGTEALSQAPISIAMGNAIDKLKEVATFITKPNTENGIEYACQYFGSIDQNS